MNRLRSWVYVVVCLLASAGTGAADEPLEKIDLVFQEYRVGTPHICRLAPTQTEARRIDLSPPDQPGAIAFGGGRPRWSPDGSKVAFHVFDDLAGTDVVIVNKDGSGWQQVTNDGIAADPAWSPDGTRLAMRYGVGRDTAIHVYTVKTRELTILADTPEFDRAPDWSKDGKHIVFSSGMFAPRSSKEDLYVVDVETGVHRAIIEQAGRDSMPRFSPDGRLIAWTGVVDRTEQLFVCTPDGKNVRQLTKEGANWSPAWSPDSTAIYHTSKRDEAFSISRTNVNTGITETVYTSESRVTSPDVRAASRPNKPRR